MLVQSTNATDKNHYIDANFRWKEHGALTYVSTKSSETDQPAKFNKTIGELVSKIKDDKTYIIQIIFANKELGNGKYCVNLTTSDGERLWIHRTRICVFSKGYRNRFTYRVLD